MSSPIPIRFPLSGDASPSSPGLYVPVHRRTPSSSSSSSPSSSSRALSPTLPMPGIYTPAKLLSLSGSPLAKLSAAHMMDALRAAAPEVVQTRKQRKALAWHARRPTGGSSAMVSESPRDRHRRAASRGSQTSESDEDKAITWRRI